jgi:hypothetical protein
VAFEILPDRHGGWLASSSARGQRYTLPSHARPFPVLPIILYKKNRAVPRERPAVRRKATDKVEAVFGEA